MVIDETYVAEVRDSSLFLLKLRKRAEWLARKLTHRTVQGGASDLFTAYREATTSDPQRSLPDQFRRLQVFQRLRKRAQDEICTEEALNKAECEIATHNRFRNRHLKVVGRDL